MTLVRVNKGCSYIPETPAQCLSQLAGRGNTGSRKNGEAYRGLSKAPSVSGRIILPNGFKNGTRALCTLTVVLSLGRANCRVKRLGSVSASLGR